MKTNLCKLLAAVMAAAMLLTACGAPAETAAPAEPQQPAASGAADAGTGTDADSAAPAEGGYVLADFKSDKPESEWKLAVVPQWGAAPWWVRGNEGTKRFASETGLNAYEASPSESEVAAQIQVVEDLIAQDVDAICICMIDPAAMEPILKTALDKGIVVISHEASTAQNVLFDLEAFSNEDYGAMMMDLLAESMGEEGTYATMVGNLTKVSHMTWTSAEVARQKEAYPNMQLLNDTNPSMESGDSSDGAYERTKELLTANPDVKSILTSSSLEPVGVGRALEEMGLAGKVKVVGTGMPSDLRTLVENGTVDSICVWDPAAACYSMLQLATKILRGEEIDVNAGVDLGVEGWTEMKPIDGNPKVLAGQGWLTYNKDNIAEGEF